MKLDEEEVQDNGDAIKLEKNLNTVEVAMGLNYLE